MPSQAVRIAAYRLYVGVTRKLRQQADVLRLAQHLGGEALARIVKPECVDPGIHQGLVPGDAEQTARLT